jgi:FkbM family methyltransferase
MRANLPLRGYACEALPSPFWHGSSDYDMSKETFIDCIIRLAHPTCRLLIRHLTPNPVGNFIWHRVCRRYLNWRPFFATARTSSGHLVNCDVSDLIQTYIYYFGIWEPNLTAFISRRLKSGDYFIDVGANIGYFSLLASRLVGPNGKVIAIEASPRIYDELLCNIQQNSITNIRSVNVAASNIRGTTKIYAGTRNNQGATTIMSQLGQEVEGEVLKIPFDEIVDLEELTSARVIKIDIEGAELPVLERIFALTDILRKDVEIVVELDPPSIEEHGSSVDDILKRFLVAGFFCYKVDNAFAMRRYLAPQATLAPERLQDKIYTRGDFIFSRVTSKYL